MVLQFHKYVDAPKEKEAVFKIVRDAMNRYSSDCCASLHNDICSLVVRPIGDFRLSSAESSHIFIAVSPMHKNEYKNLSDKIDEARDNLERYKPEENDGEYNGIIIHLHEGADINAYQQKVQNYFNSRPDIPISFILLYQALVTSDEKNERSSITHLLKPVLLPYRWINSQKRPPIPCMTFFMGNGAFDVPKRTLYADNKPIAELKDAYFYQKGEIFRQAEIFADGSIGGYISSLAPGVKLTTVLPVGPKGRRLLARFRTAETPYLEIT